MNRPSICATSVLLLCVAAAAPAHAQPALNIPSADGSLTHVAWKPAGRIERWIVSLHGTGGSAKTDLAVWQKSLGGRTEGPHSRGVGVLANWRAASARAPSPAPAGSPPTASVTRTPNATAARECEEQEAG